MAQVNRTKEIQEATLSTISAKLTEAPIDGNKKRKIKTTKDTKINLIKINTKTTLKCLAIDKIQIINLELLSKWPTILHRLQVTTHNYLKWARNPSRRRMIRDAHQNKVNKCRIIICHNLTNTYQKTKKWAPRSPINWKFKEPPALVEFPLIKLCWVTTFPQVFSNSNQPMKGTDLTWKITYWLNTTKLTHTKHKSSKCWKNIHKIVVTIKIKGLQGSSMIQIL